MNLAWRLDIQTAAGDEDDPARPNWHAWRSESEAVPFCSEDCPHHDGKRCRVLGLQAPSICEPVVAQMALMLSRGPR